MHVLFGNRHRADHAKGLLLVAVLTFACEDSEGTSVVMDAAAGGDVVARDYQPLRAAAFPEGGDLERGDVDFCGNAARGVPAKPFGTFFLGNSIGACLGSPAEMNVINPLTFWSTLYPAQTDLRDGGPIRAVLLHAGPWIQVLRHDSKDGERLLCTGGFSHRDRQETGGLMRTCEVAGVKVETVADTRIRVEVPGQAPRDVTMATMTIRP